MQFLTTDCLIVGGGPAGIMAGFLLARAGVNVTVLEKHGDFLRDFRGDTVHPSTLELMHELGLLDRFLQLPHAKIEHATAEFGGRRYTIGDFTRLSTRCKFIALMPQWDFLNFLSAEAKKLPHFRLLMKTEAKELLTDSGRVGGVRAIGPDGDMEIRAGLTIAADGRHSVLRDQSRLPLRDLGAPFDVLWLRLPFAQGDPVDLVGRMGAGQFFVMIYRGDYWQCAYGIQKGAFDLLKAQGLDRFREKLKAVAGFARDRVDTIKSFDDVKLLTVSVNRLDRWAKPGLLCIGDAAHAMSPVGGVGINLAVQDAVATANLLTPALRQGPPPIEELNKVQARREFPVKAVQGFQVIAQNRIFARVLGSEKELRVPLIVKLFDAVPPLRRLPAQFLGVGIRPEHVENV